MITTKNKQFLYRYGLMHQEEMENHLFSDKTPQSVKEIISERHDISPETIQKMYDSGSQYHRMVVDNPNTPHHLLHKLIDEHGMFPLSCRHPEFAKQNIDKYIDKSKHWGDINSLFSDRIDLTRRHIEKLKNNIKNRKYSEQSGWVATSLSWHKDCTSQDIKELRDHFNDPGITHELITAAKYKGFDLSK